MILLQLSHVTHQHLVVSTEISNYSVRYSYMTNNKWDGSSSWLVYYIFTFLPLGVSPYAWSGVCLNICTSSHKTNLINHIRCVETRVCTVYAQYNAYTQLKMTPQVLGQNMLVLSGFNKKSPEPPTTKHWSIHYMERQCASASNSWQIFNWSKCVKLSVMVLNVLNGVFLTALYMTRFVQVDSCLSLYLLKILCLLHGNNWWLRDFTYMHIYTPEEQDMAEN